MTPPKSNYPAFLGYALAVIGCVPATFAWLGAFSARDTRATSNQSRAFILMLDQNLYAIAGAALLMGTLATALGLIALSRLRRGKTTTGKPHAWISLLLGLPLAVSSLILILTHGLMSSMP